MNRSVGNKEAGLRLDRSWPMVFAVLGMTGTTLFRLSFQWHPYITWLDLVINVGLFIAVGLRVRKRVGHETSQRSLAWLVAFVIAYPLISQKISRLFGIGDPLEVMMLCAMQNAAMCCALLGNRRQWGRIAVVCSAFQLLFVSFVFMNAAIVVLLSIFGVLLLWWMMELYWERAQGAMPVTQRHYVPFRRSLILGLTGVLVIVAMGGLAIAPGGPLMQVAGWIPFSGGDRWGDRFARDGSGQGEILTGAVNNATAIAPVDTDVYLSSTQPSLYDMISKAYGKPSKQKDRKIAIDGNTRDDVRHEKTQDLAASRQFSTIRNHSDQEKETERKKSNALLFVSGDVPLHLRMETFAEFDGVNWSAGSTEADYDFALETRNQLPWFRLLRPTTNRIFSSHHHHELQIINLKTTRVPMPGQLCEWHIPQVDQPHFFQWTGDDVLEMKGREQIPAATKIGTCSRGVNLYELYQHRQWYAHQPNPGNRCTATPVPESIRRIASGWRQIEAVEQFLKSEFRLDPAFTIPDSSCDAIGDFVAAQRGPDYLFATTAAVWLNQLGYRTRLVQGLYASPSDFDRKSMLTIVGDDDVHTWLEVCVDEDNWLALEPTPGYRLPIRNLNWRQRFLLFADSVQIFARVHWAELLVFTLGGIALVWQRRRAFDLVSRGVWESSLGLPPSLRVSLCERIVRARLWFAGCLCPPAATLRIWIGRIRHQSPRLLSEQAFGQVQDFLTVWERQTFGTQRAPTIPTSSALESQPGNEDICRGVLRAIQAADFRPTGTGHAQVLSDRKQPAPQTSVAS